MRANRAFLFLFSAGIAMLGAGCAPQTPSALPSSPPATGGPVTMNQSPGLDGPSNTIAFGQRVGAPEVQPNGSILFGVDIFSAGVDGSNLRQLTTSAGGKASYKWSPDGKNVVFRWDPSGHDWNRSDIAILTVADGSVRTLAHEAWSPAWSPDGAWIAYYRASPDRYGLYLIRPDGSEDHQILAGDAEYPAWSPDGSRLVFMSLGFPAGTSSASYDLYVVDVDGGRLQRLTTSAGEDGWPAWSHDGTRIAYTRKLTEAQSEIHVMNSDGQADQLITDPDDGIEETSPNWSPNDLYIAYDAYSPDESPSLPHGLFVMRPDGTGRLQLRSDGFEPVWKPGP